MRRSLFSTFIICLFFFACGNPNPTTTPPTSNLPGKDSLKKDLIAYDNLLELENNRLLEFKDRFIEIRAKSKEAGLEKDTAFQLKMNTYKTLGSKMNNKANIALDMIAKRRVELVMLKTPPTDEFKILCIRAIDMGKEVSDLMVENKATMSQMEVDLNVLIDEALKK